MSISIKQTEVSVMAHFFYSRSSADGIVVIVRDPTQAIGQFPKETKLFVVCSPLQKARYRKRLRAELTGARFMSFHSLTRIFLADKILMYIKPERKQLFPTLRAIRIVLNDALIGITVSSGKSPQHTGSSTFIGQAREFSDSKTKNQNLELDGQIIAVHGRKFSLLPVLAIMHIYNERDIIAATINHLISQGVDVHIIDNWSNDGTFEIVKSIAQSSGKSITYERFPESDNKKFELGKMLNRVTEVAREKKEYAWVMLNDADEVRWSPWADMTLQQAFSFVDSLGYNAIDYTVFNFVPTNEGYSEKEDLLKFFRLGEFSGVPGHFVQVKSWRNNAGANLAASGGHHVAFSNQRIFPLKFLLCHYPFRSLKHAREKIFNERKTRYTIKEKQKGWHTQYDNIDEKTPFKVKNDNLIFFNQKSFYQRYLMERLSGVGIKLDQS